MEKRDEIVFLEKEEKDKLFRAIDMSEGKFKTRDRAFFKLAYYCALKTTEASLLRIADFNKANRSIICRRKNNKDMNFRIVDDEVFNCVCEYYEERMKDDKFISEYLFLSNMGKPMSRTAIQNIVNVYCSIANIEEEKRHFHILRHTRAIELLKLGFSSYELKWWMGFEKLHNASVYLAFVSKNEEVIDNDKIYRMIEKGVIDAKEENRNKKESKFNAGTFDIQRTREVSCSETNNDS